MNLKQLPFYFTLNDMVAQFGCTDADAQTQLDAWIKEEIVARVPDTIYYEAL